MYISRLYLKNWRNFKEQDIRLQPRQFVVGPNASGKSNLLDALRFLRDIAKERGGGLQEAVENRGGISKIRFLNARHDPEVVIGMDISRIGSEEGEQHPKWQYRLGIKQQVRGKRRVYVSYETVCENNEQIQARPDENNQDNPAAGQTLLEQVAQNTRFREIAEFLDSIRYMHLVPQLLRHADDIQGRVLADDPFGQGFLMDIARTSEKTRNSRLRKISELLAKVVPELQDIAFERDLVSGRPHITVRYKHWRPRGAFQQEDQLSDGTLRFIGLTWMILAGKSGAPLLLEEPELSLHGEIVKKLPGLFHRLRQGVGDRQFFISTHSADLLSDPGIAPEEMLLLHPGNKGEGTVIKSGADMDDIKNLLNAGLSMGDIAISATAPQQASEL